MNVGSLFSGIGGLDLGLERAGMRVIWQCEIDPYCRAVLKHHWPEVPCYEDIRDIGGSAERVDLICGGFPCQPVSKVGRMGAQADPRWLWPEFARVVGDLRPRYVLVENVRNLIRYGLGDVLGSLSTLGYDAEWTCLRAFDVGAPHLRERLFLVAYAEGARAGLEGREASGEGWRSAEDRREGLRPHDWSPPYLGIAASDRSDGGQWAAEPDVGRVAHGVPNRLAQLRALGNAVVPQVAEAVGRMILESTKPEAK